MLNSEQTLQLQLEVSETLTLHTTREGIGLALAEVINRLMPFEFFLHSIWSINPPIRYRISSIRTEEGKFIPFDDEQLNRIAATNTESMLKSGAFLMKKESARIYRGEDLKKLSEEFSSFAVGYHYHGIRSVMIFNMLHGNGFNHAILISDRNENAFTEEQYEMVASVLPQIKMAFDNLFKYDLLKQEDQKRELQLQLNNELLKHTNRDEFGIALACRINKIVPCERFIFRIWNGATDFGYRLPLKRNDRGGFERFSDHMLTELAMGDPQLLIRSATFVATNPGIYQGEEFAKLMEANPIFAFVSKEFGVQSVLTLAFKTDNTTCLLVLGNNTTNSFHPSHYEWLKLLMPQIILAFDNLLKYEKLRQEEIERSAQLGIMTAFNARKDIDEMALDAIGRLSELIPFEYWLNISTVASGKDIEFRFAYKGSGKFKALFGSDFFQKLQIDHVHPDLFRKDNSLLYESPRLFVGEEFEKLTEIPFFNAFRKQMNLRSLATFPLPVQGQIDTIAIMGSTRKYAFSEEDLQTMIRTMPYISMTAAQYFSLFHIQRLTRQLEMEKNYLQEEIKSSHNFDEMIGTSHLMKDVFKQIAQVASTDSTVLILGETGTGKELIARAIHNQSGRNKNVLVKVNCASLPAQLIESELFGHEKGSFTGAFEKRIGKFELANGGTIFLDEIGELPLELQAKLLRVLQEREIERLGGKTTIPLDVRIIAATNRQLENEVMEGKFRSDLYYRLNVFPIHLPPLRERREDIPLLITHFLQKYSRKMKKSLKSMKEETVQELINYEWPGNIRELENVIEQACIVGDSDSIKLKRVHVRKHEISVSKRPTQVVSEKTDSEIFEVLHLTKGKIVGPAGAAVLLDMRPSKIETVERKWILDALRKTEGRIRGDNGAAALLGLKATTLEARIKKLKIAKGEIYTR